MMRQTDIENPMVVDAYWNDYVSNPQPEKKGYYNKHREIFIETERALEYASEELAHDEYVQGSFAEYMSEQVLESPELAKIFLDWFYHNWERTGD